MKIWKDFSLNVSGDRKYGNFNVSGDRKYSIT